LPTYSTTTYGTGCPINDWEPTAHSSARISIGLTIINGGSGTYGSGLYKIAKASDISLHLTYYFYMYIEAGNTLGASVVPNIIGGSKYFGPYTLNVGCAASHVTFPSDNAAFVNSFSKWVGELAASAYTFYDPPPNPTARSWCIPIYNVVVNPDGTAWTATAQMGLCGVQPCHVWPVESTEAWIVD